MTRIRRVRIPLSWEADEIVMEFQFDVHHGLSGVSVHYRAWMHHRWVQISRYDNAHGAPHVHRHWRGREARPLSRDMVPKELVRRAVSVFKRNWRRYRRYMELEIE